MMISLSDYKNQSVSIDPCMVTQQNPSLVTRVGEVNYYLDKPWLAQRQVLPLLRHTSQQARWQLWLTPGKKLSRSWLQSGTLPVAKMMQVRQLEPDHIVQAMIRALRTGNYSVVLGWFSHRLQQEQYQQVAQAAQSGNALAILIRPQFVSPVSAGYAARNQHNGWYH